MKSDMIVSWPKNNDYPLWREMIRANRHRFGRIFIVFTETNDGVDFSEFVKEAMKHEGCDFIQQPVVRDRDWRDVAVNEALVHSHAEWVLFTEQDFFIRDGFWDEVDQFLGKVDVIAAYQEDRMHPCCMFMSRDALNRTCKNFGVVPGVSDHFSRIQKDIEEMSMKVVKIKPMLYHHMNGLSHNFNLLRQGQQPNYEPELFKLYLSRCLQVAVPLDPEWKRLAETYV